MNIVFFAHPGFMESQSMPRFVKMLAEGMQHRGHTVRIVSPKAYFSRIRVPKMLRKWFGYIDQYVIFPLAMLRMLKRVKSKTIFVLTDHAQGPWMPLIADFPHVIHCHDFLAQYSAEGMIPENRTGWSGRQYQKYIRMGYRKGKHFISVSEKTKMDLNAFLKRRPDSSTVVYNGLNRLFRPVDVTDARKVISTKIKRNALNGYILHVGGNQWYKNRIGVIDIYNSWRSSSPYALPLVLIGRAPDDRLRSAYDRSSYKDDIHFITDAEDLLLPYAYSGAKVFLFPSIGEGFGWPIAEAMACACPVITTNSAPMTEVAGGAATLIPMKPTNHESIKQWADESAVVMNQVINMSWRDRWSALELCLLNAERFDSERSLDQIEAIYSAILESRDVKQPPRESPAISHEMHKLYV